MGHIQRPISEQKQNVFQNFYTWYESMIQDLSFDIYIDMVPNRTVALHHRWKLYVSEREIMMFVWSTSRVDSDASTDYFRKSF
jgi:hypothetical protein